MPATSEQDHTLHTRPHFEMLDGLRGIAAVAVVVFHFMEIAVTDLSKNFITHAYLAVDFFFCLSGFVIAYAYDSRMPSMGLGTFLKLRLIRLHPLVVTGALLGLLSYFLDPFSSLSKQYGAGQGLLMFLGSCLMIPYPIIKERYYNLFHLNPPTWSLFYEYIANLFYALVLCRASKKLLWMLFIIATIAVLFETHHSNGLGGGWGKEVFWGGPVRVSYSFLAGMTVYRMGWIIKSRIGFLSLSLMLLAALLMPYIAGINQYTDAITVLLYFPFLVSLGAGAQVSPGLAGLCQLSGNISYPLYMTHYPFIWIFFSYIAAKKPPMNWLEILIPVCVLLLIGWAYVVMVTIDVPIRRYLKRKLVD
jgi:peptidoglycan/LPS O-acetylase OafA/YrhL